MEGTLNKTASTQSFAWTAGDSFHLDVSISIPSGNDGGTAGAQRVRQVDRGCGPGRSVPLDEGRIALGGVTLDDPDRNVFVPPEARKIGVVFQDYLLFPAHECDREHRLRVADSAIGPEREPWRRQRSGLTDWAWPA